MCPSLGRVAGGWVGTELRPRLGTGRSVLQPSQCGGIWAPSKPKAKGLRAPVAA